MSEIEVLPRVVLLNEQIVREVGEEYYLMESEAGKVINDLAEEYGKVLIVDINGVRNNRPRLNFIRMFEKKPIWVDAGVRLAETAIDVFVAGAERTIMRTRTLFSMEELRKAFDLSDQIIFQVDVQDGKTIGSPVLKAMDPRQLLLEAAEIGIRVCLYMEQGSGVPSPSIIHSFPDDFELYVGICHMDYSARFEKSNFKGIIVNAEELL